MKALNTIQTKIILLLVAVFSVLTIVTIWQSANSQRNLAADLALDIASEMADSYFNGINTMMVTGTIAQRNVLRNKLLADENVTELRMIRGKGITSIFGPGDGTQAVVDEYDKRALAGEEIAFFSTSENGRLLTLIKPFKATVDYRGTNCLTCHQVEEGSVLGAVRLSYSLANMDNKITSNLMLSSIFIFVLLFIALLLTSIVMQKIVIKPLKEIRNGIVKIESDLDFTHRFEVTSKDEIGKVAQAFNDMLVDFSELLSKVSETTQQLDQASAKIIEVSKETAIAAEQQNSETESVASAITELEASSMSVRDSATSVSDASNDADRIATEGSETTRKAIDGIYTLVNEIENASAVITTLDEHSNNVGAVLDVIKGIAEQTNLLALNAAIEAARAGEQGRGFAVVADEVRTLATRSHESTQEIENIIEQLQQGARNAVNVMSQAKSSAEQRSEQVNLADTGLKNIAEHVAHIRELNNQMVSATIEQTNVTQMVNNNVLHISELSGSTTTHAEYAAEVSQDLAKLAGRLNELVGRFKF